MGGARSGHPNQPTTSVSPRPLAPTSPSNLTKEDPGRFTPAHPQIALTTAPAAVPRGHRCEAFSNTPGPHHFCFRQLARAPPITECPGTSRLMPALAPAVPPGCPLYSTQVSPITLQGQPLCSIPRGPQLYPLQLQLSYQGTLSVECSLTLWLIPISTSAVLLECLLPGKPRDSPAYTNFSFSWPDRALMHSVCLDTVTCSGLGLSPHQAPLCNELPRTLQLALTSASAVLPGYPLHIEPQHPPNLHPIQF